MPKSSEFSVKFLDFVGYKFGQEGLGQSVKKVKGKMVLEIVTISIIQYLPSFPKMGAQFAGWHPALVFRYSDSWCERSS